MSITIDCPEGETRSVALASLDVDEIDVVKVLAALETPTAENKTAAKIGRMRFMRRMLASDPKGCQPVRVSCEPVPFLGLAWKVAAPTPLGVCMSVKMNGLREKAFVRV